MTALLQILFDALSLGSLYALAAIGIALIFGVMRLVNFAHGDYISFCVFRPVTTLFADSSYFDCGSMPVDAIGNIGIPALSKCQSCNNDDRILRTRLCDQIYATDAVFEPPEIN